MAENKFYDYATGKEVKNNPEEAYRQLFEHILITKTGINLLDFEDLEDGLFNKCIEEIFENTNTTLLKDIILLVRRDYGKASGKLGKNVIRYLLLHLREDDFEKVMPNQFTRRLLCDHLNLSSRCFPFEKRPFLQ